MISRAIPAPSADHADPDAGRPPGYAYGCAQITRFGTASGDPHSDLIADDIGYARGVSLCTGHALRSARRRKPRRGQLLPCMAGLATHRRWRATAQCVPRPWPRRTRTRTIVWLTGKRLRAAERGTTGRARRGHRAYSFRSQLSAAAAAVRPNAEAWSQVRLHARAASGSMGRRRWWCRD
jgi:hypothetical protein